jgi:hypothetical protein
MSTPVHSPAPWLGPVALSASNLERTLRHLRDGAYPLQTTLDQDVSEALSLADPNGKGVVDGNITERASGQYSITVLSTLEHTVNYTLVNGPPLPLVSGPHNTVTATCTAPAGTGTSNKAVVTVIGP